MGMIDFEYTVIDGGGDVKRGSVIAKDLSSAKYYLFKKKWVVLEIRKKREVEGGGIRFLRIRFSFRRSQLTSKQLLGFTQGIESLLRSGVSLVASLHIMVGQEKSQFLKSRYRMVIRFVEEGNSFSDALVLSRYEWDEWYLHAIQSADRSGRLLEVMEMLRGELERRVEFESKLRSAMIYPLFVLGLSSLVVLMLLVFVVPQFEGMLSDLLSDTALPLGTRWVLFLSNCVRGMWGWVAIFIFAVIFLVLLKTNFVRRRMHSVLHRVPYLGGILRLVEVERLLHTLHILLHSGLSIIEALKQVQLLRGDVLVRDVMLRVRERILEGEMLSNAISQETVFPIWLSERIKIGEETGTLDVAFKKSAEAVRVEIDRAMKLATALMEPLLVLGLAVVLGGLVVCLFWPMLSVVERMSEF